MEITSNIDGLIERFKAKAEELRALDVSQALLLGVNAAKGQMQERIFNEGLDSNLIALGVYTGRKIRSINQSRNLTKKEESVKQRLFGNQQDFSEYELIRLGGGKQVRYKDLQFDGSLRRGIVVVADGSTKVNCVITSDDLFKISIYQEEQIAWIRAGKPGRPGGERVKIFSPSKDEAQFMRENITEAIKQLYARTINT